jgi:hypothetical protein
LLRRRSHLAITGELADRAPTSVRLGAQSRIVKAQSEAKQMQIIAEGEMAQNRAKALAVSPLIVQQEAYKALAALGGTGTNIYLGDWSHLPNFLFPRMGTLSMPYSLTLPTPATNSTR